MLREELVQAGAVVAARMDELGLTQTQLAQKAGVDRSTVRAVLTGSRWLQEDTWARIVAALDWPRGEVIRRIWGARPTLEHVPTADLVHELCRRLGPSDGAHSAP